MLIERIIESSAKNRFIVILLTIAAFLAGMVSLERIPLDAIPDLTETQVILQVKWDRPAQIIEDQVAYPIVTSLLGAPKVKDIRALTDYGFSFIYILFEDGTDIYWARSRVQEYISSLLQRLPSGARVELGPDATGVGWVFNYALVDKSGETSLEDLTSFQNFNLKYALQSVKGVSEVATVGGYMRQYQVTLRPAALVARNISVSDVVEAIGSANDSTGARLLEITGKEYMITVNGYLRSLGDIRDTLVGMGQDGQPIRVGDVADVGYGPDIRRGLADLDGQGEVVGGIVVMRNGENALNVIQRVKDRISEISLPENVELVVTYDRSELIESAIKTLRSKLIEEMIVVSLIILIFLLHIPSAAIPVIILPVAVIISFIPMGLLRITTNVMSMAGIAIAIGAMVDAAIVVVENANKRLAHWIESDGVGDHRPILIKAIQEVARPSFFSLLVIAVSFLPVFGLEGMEGMEGKLFSPLAFTKTFAMVFAAVLAVTLGPALVMLFTRVKPFPLGKRPWAPVVNKLMTGAVSEEKHPVSRFLYKIYEPMVRKTLKNPKAVLLAATLFLVLSLPVYLFLGKEFMPALNEGSILYMPTTPPGISVSEAGKLLRLQDRILSTFPEVVSVFGKAGRAETATDPAPFSMMETVVVLRPQNEWREKRRWYSFLPEFFKPPFRLVWPDTISWEELVAEMEQKMQIPGQVNAWTMPIKARIDMLTTGVRTPVGIKIYGDDLSIISAVGKEIETVAQTVKGTRSVYAERTAGGYFINFDLRRDRLAAYGLTVQDVEMTLMAALGGENITSTVEGRARYPVNVRYPRELRDDVEEIRKILVSGKMGSSVPVEQVADIYLSTGPAMIRNENGRLAGYVYLDVAGIDLGKYVDKLKDAIAANVTLPPGYALQFSGQYESMERVRDRMLLLVPLTLFLIFLLLYMSTRSWQRTLIVLLAVPFSLAGAILFLFLLDYNMSVAVLVGIIALLGVDAETGIFMLLFLNLSHKQRQEQGLLKTEDDLREAIVDGAVNRLRPKLMTVATLFFGLLPIMFSMSHETGADVMKRIAAPMVGGVFVSFMVELFVYPSIYFVWRRRELRNESDSHFKEV